MAPGQVAAAATGKEATGNHVGTHARLHCVGELGVGETPCSDPKPGGGPPGPALVPAPHQRALSRALARCAMETGHRG
jgi:hypothetical protein